MKSLKLKNVLRNVIIQENYFLLCEGTIKIPKEFSIKFGILYDLLKSDYDKIINKIPKDKSNPFIIYNNFFKLKDLKDNPIILSVGLYNSTDDNASARMNNSKNVMLINMDKFKDMSLNEFEDVCFHELIHAIDPLTRDYELFDKYDKKQGVDIDNISTSRENEKDFLNYKKYKKLQYEYTAEISRLIYRIKKRVGNDKQRLKYMMWIIDNVKSHNDAEELYVNSHSEIEYMINIKLFQDEKDYWTFLLDLFDTIKFWVEDSKLYKEFIGDLYKGITT